MKVLITDRSGQGSAGAGYEAARALRGKVKSVAGVILKELGCAGREISILLTTDAEIKELNNKYLGKDKATDVLSFAMDDPVLMGDVVISLERARAQAASFASSDDEEIARLLAHGTLHLLGFEHENGGPQAAKMKRREEELLALLKSDGLI